MKIITPLSLTFLLAPFVNATAWAADFFVETENVPKTAQETYAAVERITDVVFGLFIVIAVLMLVIAAYYFLTSQGNSEKLGQGKKMLMYSIIAIVIAVSAQSIVVIVAKLVGAKVGFSD